MCRSHNLIAVWHGSEKTGVSDIVANQMTATKEQKAYGMVMIRTKEIELAAPNKLSGP